MVHLTSHAEQGIAGARVTPTDPLTHGPLTIPCSDPMQETVLLFILVMKLICLLYQLELLMFDYYLFIALLNAK